MTFVPTRSVWTSQPSSCQASHQRSRCSSHSPELTTRPFLLFSVGTPSPPLLIDSPSQGHHFQPQCRPYTPGLPEAWRTVLCGLKVKMLLLLVALPLEGYLSSIKTSNALQWCFRKSDGPSGSTEPGTLSKKMERMRAGWGRVRSMEKTQHSSTQGLDKNVTLGGRGAGSTDYVTFWLSDSLSERSHSKEASRTHRRERNSLWWQAPKLSQNVFFLKSTLHRLTVSPQNS